MPQRRVIRSWVRLLKWAITIPTALGILLVMLSVVVNYRCVAPNGDTLFIGRGHVYRTWNGGYSPADFGADQLGWHITRVSIGCYSLAEQVGLRPTGGLMESAPVYDRSSRPRRFRHTLLTPYLLPVLFIALWLWFADRKPLQRRRITINAYRAGRRAVIAIAVAWCVSLVIHVWIKSPWIAVCFSSGGFQLDLLDAARSRARPFNPPLPTVAIQQARTRYNKGVEIELPLESTAEFSIELRRQIHWWPVFEPNLTGVGIDISGMIARVNSRFLAPLWIATLLIGMPILAVWARGCRPPPGECADCGYSLTGNSSGRCPECGTQVQKQV